MESTETWPRCGFSSAEKAPSTVAADPAPLTPGTAPVTSDNTRRLALASIAIALVVGVPLLIGATARHDAAVECKGGIDKLDPFGADYRSDDGVHWTATYPCLEGGFKTIPVKRSEVPGGGR